MVGNYFPPIFPYKKGDLELLQQHYQVCHVSCADYILWSFIISDTLLLPLQHMSDLTEPISVCTMYVSVHMCKIHIHVGIFIVLCYLYSSLACDMHLGSSLWDPWTTFLMSSPSHKPNKRYRRSVKKKDQRAIDVLMLLLLHI